MEKQEKQAIEILHMMCGNNGCVISDSGGKDSSVLKHIALKVKNRYGLEYKIRHNHTTVDAPETVYFIRREKEKYEAMGVPYEIFYPAQSMWQLIVSHGTPPTRIMRYCCKDLKENTGLGEKLVTGVRKAESRNRKENQGIVTITNPKKKLVSEIEENENFQLTNKGGVVVLNLDNADMSDVIMQYDHTGRVFARQSNKTLILEPDAKGLFVAADLSKTDLARGLYQDIDAGMITKMSWAFTVAEESYDRETHTRTILKIKKVYDVSAVSIPANNDTEISARNFANRSYEQEKQELLKRRAMILKIKTSL